MALQDYMVPISKEFVWVAYQKQYPWLPVAVADTARELSSAIGVAENSITRPIERSTKTRDKKVISSFPS